MGSKTMISMIIRALLVVAAVVSLVAVPTIAQESEIAPEHIALARKYVELTDRGAIYETTLIEAAIQTMKVIVAQNPDINEPVNTAITKTLDVYKGQKGQLLDQFARVYALSFTMEELQEIVTFYESPVGAKLAAANATLNDSLRRVMTVFRTNLNIEFLAKVRAELKSAGYDV
jgi:uncharacterized protein